jgi:hypothetical protein
MKSLAKAARVNKAIEVIQHMNNGMTTVDACKEVGLPRSSYYDIINNNPEAIAEYHEMVQINARQQLGMILSNKTEILHKIIEDGLSDDTAPRDRLAIYKALNELDDKLSSAIESESVAADFISEYLQGPKLKWQESRLTVSNTTITLEGDN